MRNALEQILGGWTQVGVLVVAKLVAERGQQVGMDQVDWVCCARMTPGSGMVEPVTEVEACRRYVAYYCARQRACGFGTADSAYACFDSAKYCPDLLFATGFQRTVDNGWRAPTRGSTFRVKTSCTNGCRPAARCTEPVPPGQVTVVHCDSGKLCVCSDAECMHQNCVSPRPPGASCQPPLMPCAERLECVQGICQLANVPARFETVCKP
jgi:hypothetical protein